MPVAFLVTKDLPWDVFSIVMGLLMRLASKSGVCIGEAFGVRLSFLACWARLHTTRGTVLHCLPLSPSENPKAAEGTAAPKSWRALSGGDWYP